MTPEALAALHARCFDASPPPWSAASFAELLAAPTSFLLTRTCGFALGRAFSGEAELLTLAVAPEARRRGQGRALVAAFEAECVRRGAMEAFLEVSEANDAARALYARAGYVEAGRRHGYYARPDSAPSAALILRKRLATTRAEPGLDGKTD